MRASGVAGELRVAYQQAAVLGAWTLEQEPCLPPAYQFRAQIVRTHDYWLTQRPIDLVVAVGRTEWRWPDVAVAREGAEVIVVLRTRPVVTDRVISIEGAQA